MIARSELRTVFQRAWRYYRRRGLSATFTHANQVARYGVRGLERSPKHLPDGVAVTDPRGVLMHVERPRIHSVVADGVLVVTGWACSTDEVDAVELYVDGIRVAEVKASEPRADIRRRLPAIAQSGRSGFSSSIDLSQSPEMQHELVVVARDGRGRARAASRSFLVMSRKHLYDLWVEREARRREWLLPLQLRFNRSTAPWTELWVDATRSAGGTDALTRTLASINEQRHARWRVSIVAPEGQAASMRERVKGTVGVGYASLVRVIDGPDARPPETTGFHLLLEAGEVLAPNALAHLVVAAQKLRGDLVYSDHDLVDARGARFEPTFAPDWSPIHALSRNFVGGVMLVRDTSDFRARLAKVLPSADPAWRLRLLLDLARSGVVIHVPRMLWSAPADRDDVELAEAELVAVNDYLERNEHGATATMTSYPGVRQITWPMARSPRVSIVIPTTCRLDLVRMCVDSITGLTDYPDYELVFLDNGRGKNRDGRAFLEQRGLRVIERDEPFNWARLSNAGAAAASGELLLFLNDDVEVVDPGWLRELASLAIRPSVGSVGALLLYPNGLIQHAGVLLVRHGGGATHWFQRVDPGKGVYGDLHQVAREVAANTGACMMVQRDRFERVGGFDETFAISGNDVDFCLRLAQAGLTNLWTPRSRLVHHESISRKDTAVEDDETRLWRTWHGTLEAGDPYYSRLFTEETPDCTVAVDLDRKAARRAARYIMATSHDPSPGSSRHAA